MSRKAALLRFARRVTCDDRAAGWSMGGEVLEHQGPGPHPGGSPQAVHAGGGAGAVPPLPEGVNGLGDRRFVPWIEERLAAHGAPGTRYVFAAGIRVYRDSTGDHIKIRAASGMDGLMIDSLFASRPGSGLGRPLVLALKDYCDATGQKMEVHQVTNHPFWSKFSFLEKLSDDPTDLGPNYVYKPPKRGRYHHARGWSIREHYGPGPHPKAGTPQASHAGGRMARRARAWAKVKRRQGLDPGKAWTPATDKAIAKRKGYGPAASAPDPGLRQGTDSELQAEHDRLQWKHTLAQSWEGKKLPKPETLQRVHDELVRRGVNPLTQERRGDRLASMAKLKGRRVREATAYRKMMMPKILRAAENIVGEQMAYKKANGTWDRRIPKPSEVKQIVDLFRSNSSAYWWTKHGDRGTNADGMIMLIFRKASMGFQREGSTLMDITRYRPLSQRGVRVGETLERLQEHEGPGPHANGSPQAVHGGGGMGGGAVDPRIDRAAHEQRAREHYHERFGGSVTGHALDFLVSERVSNNMAAGRIEMAAEAAGHDFLRSKFDGMNGAAAKETADYLVSYLPKMPHAVLRRIGRIEAGPPTTLAPMVQQEPNFFRGIAAMAASFGASGSTYLLLNIHSPMFSQKRQAEHEANVESGFAPPGLERVKATHYIITHEMGHVLEKAGKDVAGRLPGPGNLVDRQKRFEAAWDKVVVKDRPVSHYAAESKSEAFAEAFALHQLGHKSWRQHPHVDFVDRVLRAIEPYQGVKKIGEMDPERFWRLIEGGDE